MFISLTRQTTLRREMDVVANNLANINTPGFKAEMLMLEPVQEKPASQQVGPHPISFVGDWGQWRDMSAGAIQQTGNSLDFAIGGDGFFEIDTDQGVRYTRDGRFEINDAGELITRNGDKVRGDGGAIALDLTQGSPSVAADGTISQNGAIIGRLAVVQFAENQALEKIGDNLYTSDEVPQAAPEAIIRQGMIERSNVNAVQAMTQLIEIQRAYERSSRLISSAHDLAKQTIQRFGRPAQ